METTPAFLHFVEESKTKTGFRRKEVETERVGNGRARNGLEPKKFEPSGRFHESEFGRNVI